MHTSLCFLQPLAKVVDSRRYALEILLKSRDLFIACILQRGCSFERSRNEEALHPTSRMPDLTDLTGQEQGPNANAVEL